MTRYAAATEVPVEKTRAEIEATLNPATARPTSW
jgi:hypothetical protein